MNRFIKFSFASFAILFVLAFISCKSNDEDDDSPAPKNKLSVTATEASTAGLGGSYSKDITVAVDFAENAVLSSRVALSTTSENLANGDDIKDLLKANIVNANGVSADSFSISSAIIKSLSAQSITFSVAGTAPSENSSVTLTLLLPPKFMKDGLPFGKPVQKVSVGTGVTASNTAAAVSIPKKTDLAGKILKTIDGDASSYYVFDENSNITRYYSGHRGEWGDRTLSYDETKGEIVSTSKVVEKIISANGTYYIVDWDEIPRTEVSGLEGVFHVFVDEGEEDGVPVSTETTITLNGDETLSYYKIEIDRTGKDEERHTEKRYLIGGGAYINKNGILSISGTWFHFSKNADTDEELENEIMPAATLELIYDGSTFYLTGGSCSFAEESELPASTSN
ncbi:MAG: hypothetical protein IJJ71_04460 [Treponema sp.]|uniref:hypothetical protein n=1 Tax=Treponema sp. TaxID=166 RepID=UPI0025E3A1D5|nr:hypothetical protein [Treponema sp.]MBR0495414.1 hypothetical protein [Treponema sp.]